MLIGLSLLLANSFWSCEKDDICTEGTPTTPNVVIEFYDAANPTTPKTVTNLGIIAPGFSTGFTATNVSKIKLPLKVNSDITEFQFTQNGTDTDLTNDNIDNLTFNYTREDVYISRACGYKTLFHLTAAPTVTDGDTSLWISSVTVNQSYIQNENETHIKIYF